LLLFLLSFPTSLVLSHSVFHCHLFLIPFHLSYCFSLMPILSLLCLFHHYPPHITISCYLAPTSFLISIFLPLFFHDSHSHSATHYVHPQYYPLSKSFPPSYPVHSSVSIQIFLFFLSHLTTLPSSNLLSPNLQMLCKRMFMSVS
jgi:hypothetical protein